MKKIIGYLKDYFQNIDKRIFVLASLFISIAIFINYYFGLNRTIADFDKDRQYVCWYFIFITAFSFGYILLAAFKKDFIFKNRKFVLLLLIAPAIFSWKMVFDIDLPISADEIKNIYWNRIIYWPFKLVIVTGLIFLIWKIWKEDQPMYGLTLQSFKAKPYFIMLLIMLPLIAAASTQHDFLMTYPKLKNVSFLNAQPNTGLYKLLYELSYGSDFFTIEIFFRGFLVLAFAKWFGKDAILPMALFYCTIHFGKPLGECISSFFGGIILGVVVYHTKTIVGGLMVHLGIAWLMELGGYIGHQYF